MYNLNVCNIFKNAEDEMLSLKHLYVAPEHLFLALLKKDNVIKLLGKFGLDYNIFKKEIINLVGICNSLPKVIFYTPQLKKIIYNATEDAIRRNDSLDEFYLLRSILEEDNGLVNKILGILNVDIDNLYENIIKMSEKNINNLDLFKIATNLNETVDLDDKVIGRDKELELIMETLIRKNKNNPLLIGEAGVGKTAIVEELARRIKKGNVLTKLKNAIIVNLELSSLISGTKYRGEFEEKLLNIIKEVEKHPNIILFIDEIHGIVNAGGAEGAINASDILKPYLARGKIKVIGATTFNEYNKFINKDKALARRFENIKILEPRFKETIDILEKTKSSYEKHYGIKITTKNIIDIINLTNKYILNRKNPDKSFDILDSTCAYLLTKKENVSLKDIIKKKTMDKELAILNKDFKNAIKIHNEINKLKESNCFRCRNINITKDDILTVIMKKNNLPLFNDKLEKIALLKNELPKKIHNQNNAIKNIIKVIDRGIKDVKPLSMLFIGSKNIDKKYIALEIAKILDMNIIALDMNEFDNEISLSRLIGKNNYLQDDAILNKVILEPNSIILLDNIDKCCQQVLNLFIKILDDGYITNYNGDKINFNNCIILMISNKDLKYKIGFDSNKPYINDLFTNDLLTKVHNIIPFSNMALKDSY